MTSSDTRVFQDMLKRRAYSPMDPYVQQQLKLGSARLADIVAENDGSKRMALWKKWAHLGPKGDAWISNPVFIEYVSGTLYSKK